jgi:SAM-dependent methyltransferase
MSSRDMKRFENAVEMIEEENYKTVLDLGCRDKILKTFLRDDIEYQGVDYKDGDEIVGHNLEQGIPFPDNSFDIVFALDVLEHVENIHLLYEEILRVTKKEAIVALPNMSYWKFRLRYLKGKDMSGKYIFPTTKILDRHRWLTSYDSSIRFINSNSKEYVVREAKGFYQYGSNFLRALDKKLSKKFPNLFTYTVFFQIKKT